MLGVLGTAVDLDVVRSLVELGGVAGVVGSVADIAPVVTRSGDLQVRLLHTRIEGDLARLDRTHIFVIAEGIVAIPEFHHIDIRIVGRTFGVFKDGGGVVAGARLILFAIVFELHQALQHGGVVGHVEVIDAFHAEGGDVTAELHPFATVVLHAHIALVVVGVAVAVHAVVQVMQVDGVEGVDMGRERKFAVGIEVLKIGHHLAVEGGDGDVVVVGGHLKGVGSRGGLAACLDDAHGHVVGAGAGRRPGGVPVAVLGVVGIVGLQGQFLTIDGGFHFFKLQDVAMVDVGTQHDHHGVLEVGHIDLGAFVGTADGDLRGVVFGVHHIERTGHRRGGLPFGAVARLDGAYLYQAFLAGEGEDITIHGGRTLGNLEGHGQTRSGRGLQGDGVVIHQLVGDAGEVDELRSQSARDITDDQVVETAPTAVEHEDIRPGGRIVFVAAAWGQAGIGTLALGNSFPFVAGSVILRIEGDGTGTIVGIEVDGQLPTEPSVIRVRRIQVADNRIAGQDHTGDEVAVACGTT